MTIINQAAATLLALTALAWPAIACAVRELAASPLERALRTAWCGEPHAAASWFGHCAAGWAGALVLMAAALLACAWRAPHAGARRRLR